MNDRLSAATAAWDADNESWWDWYMTLAENDAGDALVEVPASDPGPLPDEAAVVAELARPYPVPGEAIAEFAADGFVRPPGVISPGAAELLRRRLAATLADRAGTSGLLNREMMWREDDLVRAAVLSPRIGGISAANLLL